QAGSVQQNLKKNRYKDVLPYDQSRVVLSLPAGGGDSDYINASVIQGATKGRTYIASQGPLSSTVTDFWRMIWEYDVKVVVMACREREMGKKECERYWAPLGQSATFGPFTVCDEAETEATGETVVRTLSVTYNQETHSLVQYHFLSWPDHEVPPTAPGVLDLLERARTAQGTHTSPLLVHCSAGCGRTGVICALDYIHDLLVTKQITADFSIMKVVLELRTQRPAAVQTKDQYLFIFRVVASMFESFLQAGGSLSSNPSEERPVCASSSRQTGSITSSSGDPSGLRLLPITMTTISGAVPCTASSKAGPSAPPGPPRRRRLTDSGRSGPRRSATTAAFAWRQVSGGKEAGERGISQKTTSLDDDYEDVSPDPQPSLCSPGHMGFNLRVQKPRGPRDLPAEWRRL
uniref:protein-tyrosine-phosphatase n=1 Tax=Tetraodon nigroviridis TaxID=99883 RepID=H3CE14_TETNG